LDDVASYVASMALGKVNFILWRELHAIYAYAIHYVLEGGIDVVSFRELVVVSQAFIRLVVGTPNNSAKR